MRPQPRSQQRPEPLDGVDVDLAEPIAVLVAGELAGRMADRAMRVAPRRQPGLDIVFIRIDHAPRADRRPDDRADGRLLDVLQHPDDDLPGPLNHAEDRRLLLLQGAAAPRAFQAPAPTGSLSF